MNHNQPWHIVHTTGALKRSKLHANCRYCLPLLGIEAYRKRNGIRKGGKKSLKKFKAYPPPPLFENSTNSQGK
ncbi:hypothetical protein CEXT_525901 [Caerostris extrusa]|uniref:Uncharacterized protein n=1 Tax=Caerostris extrusa TaxID=172846 RepID=A0AAV4PHQ2_CAEEX|nr:hypothetical protein CEXT_525901 [Caerostris extrusa]